MEKFTLIDKDRSRIKVFEPFEDVSKPSPSIDAMMVSYGCVYKRSSKPVMKGSRVETVEAARTILSENRSSVSEVDIKEAIEFQEERINALEGRRIIDVQAD